MNMIEQESDHIQETTGKERDAFRQARSINAFLVEEDTKKSFLVLDYNKNAENYRFSFHAGFQGRFWKRF